MYLISNFISGIPTELDEAAKIDGCSYAGIFTRIMLPLIKPALVTACIFSFMWRWDDFLSALLYVSKSSMYPVSLALKLFCDPGSSIGLRSHVRHGNLVHTAVHPYIPVFPEISG